jgi:small subunit ribosomal protein S16
MPADPPSRDNVSPTPMLLAPHISDPKGDTTHVAVKIRLKRMGKIRAPFYRIVVADSRTKRDGRVIEEIGQYHPKADPSFIEVDTDRAQYWLEVGAQPSEPVTAILKLTGDWQKFKGEPAPAALKVAEPKRAKADLFNDALKDAHGDLGTEAVTRKRTAKKAAAPAREVPTKPAATADEVADPAADAPSEAAPVEPVPEIPDAPAAASTEPDSETSSEVAAEPPAAEPETATDEKA